MSKQAPNADKPKTGHRVYSYIRFSDPRQAQGTSEERQLDKVEVTRKWAEQNGHDFDDRLMIDRGYSGYHGEHRKKGVLGEFLKLVDDSMVPRGSFLAVEDLHRLSREEPLEALDMILHGLIKHDITIVTFSPYAVEYNRKSLNDGMIFALLALIKMNYESSKMKSDLARGYWKIKRKQAQENGDDFPGSYPLWLSKGKAGEWVVDAKAAKAINLLFDLKLKGYGAQRIRDVLNTEGYWRRPKRLKNGKREPGTGWHISGVQFYLQYIAVIGHKQPYKIINGKRVIDPDDPDCKLIENHYPQIVPPKKFYAVQKLFRLNRRTGGRTGEVRNLFKDIIKCAYCDGTMSSNGKGSMNLVCYEGRRKVKCKTDKPHKVRYAEVEETILKDCHHLRPEQVLPSPDEQERRCAALHEELSRRALEIENIAQEIENLKAFVARTPDPARQQRYDKDVTDREEQQKTLAADQEKDQAEYNKAKKGQDDIERWKKNFDGMLEAMRSDNTELRQHTRLRLRLHLRELIVKIEVFAAGHRKLFDADACAAARGAAFDAAKRDKKRKPGSLEYLRDPRVFEGCDGEKYAQELETSIAENEPRKQPDKCFRRFLNYITKRRMSKDGRFLRVYFTTGAIVDMVPNGSIASGSKWTLVQADEPGEMDYMAWKAVGPALAELWAEYRRIRPNVPEQPGLEDTPPLRGCLVITSFDGDAQ